MSSANYANATLAPWDCRIIRGRFTLALPRRPWVRNLLEVHVVFSRECFGPDVPASLTTGELKQMVDGVRFIERALSHPIDKEAQAADLAAVRRTFGKSVVAARALPAGHRIAAEDLAFKKPGTGIPASRYQSVVGTVTKRDIPADTLLSEGDFE